MIRHIVMWKFQEGTRERAEEFGFLTVKIAQARLEALRRLYFLSNYNFAIVVRSVLCYNDSGDDYEIKDQC